MSLQKQYINLNGDYFDANEPILSHRNRGFLYGDALFETIHANGTQLQFFDDHLSRLQEGMRRLGMTPSPSIQSGNIEKECVKLLQKNKHLKGARVRITVFRNQGGKYTPENNHSSYLIDSENLPFDQYRLNEKGYHIDLFSELKKPLNFLSNLKTTNDLIYVLAGNFKASHNLDECILINQHNEVCEGISSNVFMVKNDVLKTPPLRSGCLDGIMRRKVLSFAASVDLKISDNHPITPQELLESDEIFFTNAIKGIQWVGGFRQKRYYKQTAKLLTEVLNEKTKLE